MIPKFRAYLKDKNELRDVVEIRFKNDKEIGFGHVMKAPYVVVEGWDDMFSLDDVILMQSTGLKDKHGIEIFERDIIQWTSEVTRQTDWVGLVKREKSGFVVWTSERAYSTSSWLNVAHEKVEVIGDQYEHHYLAPELLKESAK